MSDLNALDLRVSAIEAEMTGFRDNVGAVVEGVSHSHRRVHECLDSIETLTEDRRRLKELVDGMVKILENQSQAIAGHHELIAKLTGAVQTLRREVDTHRSKLGLTGKLSNGTLN